MNILNINQETAIDTKWEVLKGAIKTVTDSVIGKKKREQRNRGSMNRARKRLTEGKKQGLNCSTTLLIERKWWQTKNAKKKQIIYLDMKNGNIQKMYKKKPRLIID